MVGLDAGAERAFFISTKLPIWALSAELGAGPQPREGADDRAVADLAPTIWQKAGISTPSPMVTPGPKTTKGPTTHVAAERVSALK